MKKIHCAGVIFITSENKVLLEDRRRIKKHQEHWSFFGGSVEKGETHEEAMIREIREETNFLIKDYEYFKKYVFSPKEKPDLELTYHMYLARSPNLKKMKIHERGGAKEFTFKQALKLRITEKDKEILRDVLEFLNKK
jgi:mutator protein MutT